MCLGGWQSFLRRDFCLCSRKSDQVQMSVILALMSLGHLIQLLTGPHLTDPRDCMCLGTVREIHNRQLYIYQRPSSPQWVPRCAYACVWLIAWRFNSVTPVCTERQWRNHFFFFFTLHAYAYCNFYSIQLIRWRKKSLMYIYNRNVSFCNLIYHSLCFFTIVKKIIKIKVK